MRLAMATPLVLLTVFLVNLCLLPSIFASRRLPQNSAPDQLLLVDHKGTLLQGNISVDLIWYGNFSDSKRAIVSDFIVSTSSAQRMLQPSVASWWRTLDSYYAVSGRWKSASSTDRPVSLHLGRQVMDWNCSMGRFLGDQQIAELASKVGERRNGITVVFTAMDVTVEGFCSSRCGSHGSYGHRRSAAYVWVGNSESQCPGQCAWPFHRPIYGPQTEPLVAPNGDVGVDGMVINLASLLAGTVTDPFGDGFYQGSAEAPLEAASACPGIYGSGSYPGYAGKLLKDPNTGGSYNAVGVGGRKFLLPALYDLSTASCRTLL